MTTRLFTILLLLAPALSFADERQTVTVLVFGEESTGRRIPLAGAQVSCWTEDVRPVSLGSRLVAESRTDEYGVATLSVPNGEDIHWLVSADGFGVGHEYGTAALFEDGGSVVLTPGDDRRIRVLGPFGKPLAGARLEMTIGCSHSPAARVATTGPDGIATLPNVSDYGWDLWILAPGIWFGPYTVPARPALGAPPVIITDWGASATGTVVDEEGKPVTGAVVRELDGFRGPVTATDDGGAFALHGLTGTAEIGVFLDGSKYESRPAAVARAFTEDVPLRFVVRTDRPTSLGDGEPRHRLDVVIEEGDSFVPMRIVRISDGLTMKRNSGFYTNTFDVPAGQYRITAGGGFSFEAATTVRVTVPTPGHEEVRIPLKVQQGAFAVRHSDRRRSDDKAVLLIPGYEKRITLNAIVWLPEDGPAALLVKEPYERLIPLPAGKDGDRYLDLPEFEPTVLRFRLTSPAGKELTPDMDAEVGEDGWCTMETFESGEVDLTFKAEGCHYRDEVVVLPPAPAAIDLGTIVLQPESIPSERTLRLVSADGKETLETEETDDAYQNRFVTDVEGYLPMTLALSPDGPTDFRFPAGRIEIEVEDAKDVSVWLDGWEFEGEESPIIIRGVPDGAHRLTVLAPGKPVRSQMVTVTGGGAVTVR